MISQKAINMVVNSITDELGYRVNDTEREDSVNAVKQIVSDTLIRWTKQLQHENEQLRIMLTEQTERAEHAEYVLDVTTEKGQLCYEALLNNQADNTAYKPEDWQKIQEAIKAWEDLQK